MSNPFYSILNDVLGPVMRGPSSSHTAGCYHIGRLLRSLLGKIPEKVHVIFDPDGSMATTFRPLASDLALAAGLMEWELIDERFPKALTIAKNKGLELSTSLQPLENKHPNAMIINTETGDEKLRIHAAAIGGGGVSITGLNGFELHMDGKSHDILLTCPETEIDHLLDILSCHGIRSEWIQVSSGTTSLIHVRSPHASGEELTAAIKKEECVGGIRIVPPLFYPKRSEQPFISTSSMIEYALSHNYSLGEAGLHYEWHVLGLSRSDITNEMDRRFAIMQQSVFEGLDGRSDNMALLEPTAGAIFKAAESNSLPTGGIHARAAAMAMAAMHTSNSLGIVCAAPTAGSAGVLPGVLTALFDTGEYSREQIILSLFAASAIGLIILNRATFAAEVAGCQVEIGAAGAMGAAAVVDLAGGTPEQAVNAAAICLQNTMGSVCDPVHGTCEIPCHTRNAAAASGALLAADLIIGGYQNPIPLDETIDAVLETGKAMPAALRCTALGGIAITPSAKAMTNKRF